MDIVCQDCCATRSSTRRRWWKENSTSWIDPWLKPGEFHLVRFNLIHNALRREKAKPKKQPRMVDWWAVRQQCLELLMWLVLFICDPTVFLVSWQVGWKAKEPCEMWRKCMKGEKKCISSGSVSCIKVEVKKVYWRAATVFFWKIVGGELVES